MSFNPLHIFNEKNKKPVPPRGAGGKFLSTKKPKEEIPEVALGPHPITFYSKEIRRYYKGDAWYYSLEDIARIADVNPDNPNIRPGNPEKLDEGKKKYAIKIEGVEVAKAEDIVKFIPYFKGNLPGPITDSLLENSRLPAPKKETSSKPD